MSWGIPTSLPPNSPTSKAPADRDRGGECPFRLSLDQARTSPLGSRGCGRADPEANGDDLAVACHRRKVKRNIGFRIDLALRGFEHPLPKIGIAWIFAALDREHLPQVR